MEYSPETIGQWQDKGKVKKGLEKLKDIRLSYAMACCTSFVYGSITKEIDKRNGKIALAASKGILNLLLKSQERG